MNEHDEKIMDANADKNTKLRIMIDTAQDAETAAFVEWCKSLKISNYDGRHPEAIMKYCNGLDPYSLFRTAANSALKVSYDNSIMALLVRGGELLDEAIAHFS